MIDENIIIKNKYKPLKKFDIDKKLNSIIKKLKVSKRPLIHLGHEKLSELKIIKSFLIN